MVVLLDEILVLLMEDRLYHLLTNGMDQLMDGQSGRWKSTWNELMNGWNK